MTIGNVLRAAIVVTPWALGTSLEVQWLKLCAPNTGDPGLIPGQGTRSHILLLKVCMSQLKYQASPNLDMAQLKKKSMAPGVRRPGLES